MAAGASRLAPFLLASAAIHGALLIAAPERLALDTAPVGTAHSISIELVPAGRPAERAAAPGAVEAVPQRETARARMHRGSSDGAPEPEVAQASTETATREPATGDISAAEMAPADSDPEARPAEADPAATPDRAPPPRGRVAEAAPQPPAQARPGPRAPAGAGARGEALRAAEAERVRAHIASRLAQHFRYPRLARQRGWEGRVVLAFRVLADGRLRDIRVAESSGRAILDDAAVRALERVGRVPALGERAGAGPLALELPVTYRLHSA